MSIYLSNKKTKNPITDPTALSHAIMQLSAVSKKGWPRIAVYGHA